MNKKVTGNIFVEELQVLEEGRGKKAPLDPRLPSLENGLQLPLRAEIIELLKRKKGTKVRRSKVLRGHTFTSAFLRGPNVFFKAIA